MKPAVVWFRHDLRLADHPALATAAASGRPLIPVYVHAPQDEGAWAPGGASRVWLLHSLRALAHELAQSGSRLIVRHGSAATELPAVCAESGADVVYFNHRHEPAARAVTAAVVDALADVGIDAQVFEGTLLFPPERLRNRRGEPYRVFTAFWNHCLRSELPAAPQAPPRQLIAPGVWPASQTVERLALQPRPDWAAGIRDCWHFGTRAAGERLARFIDRRLAGYAGGRDQPGDEAVSGLSASLHFGEIGVREVWQAVRARQASAGATVHSQAVDAFLRQLGWREFGHHLLHHYPDSPQVPLTPAFEYFPWHEDAAGLRAWQQGITGFPFVDAGMRELWHTGYMHNRARMVVASFLIKDLLLHWHHGARWFWDTLVDADLANNTLGWQWSAGCGADAAPYFRIFNPVRQSERFDSRGTYIRRWIPELAQLPDAALHAPWLAGDATLRKAGVRLDRDYPRPIVDHAVARRRALAALEQMREAAGHA